MNKPQHNNAQSAPLFTPSAPPLGDPPPYTEVIAQYKKYFRFEIYDKYMNETEETFHDFIKSIPSLMNHLKNTKHNNRATASPPKIETNDKSSHSTSIIPPDTITLNNYNIGNTTVVNNSGTNDRKKDSSSKASPLLVLCTVCIFCTFIFSSFYYLYKSRTSKLHESKYYFQSSLFSSVASIAFSSLLLSFISGLIVENPQQYCGVDGINWTLLSFVILSVSASIVTASVASALISADKLNAKQKIDDAIDESLNIKNQVKEKTFLENFSTKVTEWNVFAHSREGSSREKS